MGPEKTGTEQRAGWPKGHSGNPAGRPKGSRNRVLRALDQIGSAAAREILQAAVGRATAGDMRAVETILSRVWPPRKGRPVCVNLPALGTAADLPKALAVVAQDVACGALTPEEAQAIAAILDAQRAALETENLARRIDLLEAMRPVP